MYGGKRERERKRERGGSGHSNIGWNWKAVWHNSVCWFRLAVVVSWPLAWVPYTLYTCYMLCTCIYMYMYMLYICIGTCTVSITNHLWSYSIIYDSMSTYCLAWLSIQGTVLILLNISVHWSSSLFVRCPLVLISRVHIHSPLSPWPLSLFQHE